VPRPQRPDQPSPSPSEEEDEASKSESADVAGMAAAVAGIAVVIALPRAARVPAPPPPRIGCRDVFCCAELPLPPNGRPPPMRGCNRSVVPGPTPTSARREPKSKHRSPELKPVSAATGEGLVRIEASTAHMGRGGKTSHRSISYHAANSITSILSSFAAKKKRSATQPHAAMPTLTPQPELKMSRRLSRTGPRPPELFIDPAPQLFTAPPPQPFTAWPPEHPSRFPCE
jgi:hypothetical protein